jgi:hypothetical protein
MGDWAHSSGSSGRVNMTVSAQVKKRQTQKLIAEFPHLYSHLEGENVDSFKEIHRQNKDWASALDEPDVKGWMEY